MLFGHQPQLDRRLAAMLPHRRAHISGDGMGALQKRLGAGLDPVGREHGADAALGHAVDAGGKRGRVFQPPQPPRLVIDRADIARAIRHLPAGPIGRP